MMIRDLGMHIGPVDNSILTVLDELGEARAKKMATHPLLSGLTEGEIAQRLDALNRRGLVDRRNVARRRTWWRLRPRSGLTDPPRQYHVTARGYVALTPIQRRREGNEWAEPGVTLRRWRAPRHDHV